MADGILRRLSESRLSEIAGEQALLLDYFCRMIGMPGMKRQIFQAATEEERGFLQAYTDGVNAYLAARGKDFPCIPPPRLSMPGSPRKWSWGRLHRHVFRHPGASSPFTRMLLNPRPCPASGDMNTLNVSWSVPALDSYDVTTIPSMRMITSLGDLDSLRIVGPLGQSGQPGHAHYEELTPLWLRGEQVPIPLTRAAVEKIAKDRLTLVPKIGAR